MGPSHMYAVVGLGNPGRRYARTRHNAGFRVVDELARRHRIGLWRRRFHAVCGKGRLAGRETWLLKPQTYMNLSGRAVMTAAAQVRFGLDHLLVVSDDIALPLGSLRFRERGSAGGHKGLVSIIDELGTTAFARLRVGVGAPAANQDAAAYVLENLRPEEEPILETAVARAADAVELWMAEGPARAMATFNA